MSITLAYTTVLHHNDELEELISGCVRNDRIAQGKLYALFYPKMMSMVRRYFPEQVQAEEILNNGFLRAFQKIDSFAFKGSFEGWLRRIVFHAISDYVKGHVKYTSNVVLIEKDELINKDHGSRLYYEDLMKLIHQLPEATRIVFNMFAVDEMTHREIAIKLNISEGTSKWHVHAARKILKEKVEGLNLHIKI